MSKVAAPIVDVVSGNPGSAGHPVNHVCFSMTAPELDALLARLAARGRHSLEHDDAIFRRSRPRSARVLFSRS
jgi:hypothetical protein